MKKNFLKIAALLIAAMLLVVSCAPEATVKNESNLVEVNLSTSVASKSLTFGDTLASATDLTYKYYLKALWDKTSVDEEVVGETTDTGVQFEINNETGVNLGYLSQGYWKITVKGFDDNDNVVLYGETNHYVTKGKGNITVFLNTSGDDNSTSTLDFEINVNDLAEGNDGYDLYYSITGKNYKGEDEGVEETKFSTKTTLKNGQASKYVTKFTDSVANLKPGYYRVTVTLKKGTDVIGGITRGFLLVNGDTEVTLSGSVSASDFIKSTLNVYTPEVTISSVSAKVGSTEYLSLPEGGDVYEGTITGASEENKVSVTYSVDSSFSINGQTSGVVSVSGPTYSWMFKGKQVGTNQTYTTDYAPGHQDVTCIVTYTYTCKVGETETEFAVSNEACTYLLVKDN